MAKILEVTVGKSVLVNTGNYENVRIEHSVTMSIDNETDQLNVDQIRDKAMEGVNSYIRDEVDAIELKARKQLSKAGRFGV